MPGVSDAFFVGVPKTSPSSAATEEVSAADQTKNSAFLTVQSFTNFAAATGAITGAWLALQALNEQHFSGRWVPFVLSCLWLVVSLITSAQAGAASEKKTSFWVSSIFLGFMNALTLFAAVIGVSGSVT